MAVTLHVNNVPFDHGIPELTALFEGYGDVRRVTVPTDAATGRPRGFAFIEMADEIGARAAIEALNHSRLEGRTLRVSRARPRT